jgi:hypothetical protein
VSNLSIKPTINYGLKMPQNKSEPWKMGDLCEIMVSTGTASHMWADGIITEVSKSGKFITIYWEWGKETKESCLFEWQVFPQKGI